MPMFTMASDTLTQGKLTKKLWAESYPDALLIMDNIVDALDGITPGWEDLPDTLTFDELLSGRYGEIANYIERYGRWQILLPSGWFYTGNLNSRSEIGKRCDRMSKLDANTI